MDHAKITWRQRRARGMHEAVRQRHVDVAGARVIEKRND